MKRPILALLGIGLSIVAVVAMHVLLPENAARVMLDRGGQTYPISVQNVMWVIFFVGLAEIYHRYTIAKEEAGQLKLGYLPEDYETLLVASNLPEIFKKVSLAKGVDYLFLPGLIKRIISVYQTTQSVENANAVLTSSIDLRSHDLDLKYNILRYVMWVIPTLGFIGTVIGISLALAYAGEPGRGQDPTLLTELTKRLAVAFYTTLVALIMSAVLLLIMNIVQSFEERVANSCGQYCLDNLVNRLYKSD
jgi:MotA/TolQ/ExbB proton channel family